MSGEISEKLLLYRIKTKHDPEAFAELYDAYVKQIYRFIYFKVSSREEAEDIASEVFLKAWEYLQQQKEVHSFSGLLYRISRNAIIDLYRRKSAQPEQSLEADPDWDRGDGGRWYADVGVKIETKRVVQFLKKLKQEYQEVITLRYVDELSVEEIAEIMGKGKIAVRVTLHRALKRLKILLAAAEQAR